MQTYTRRYPKGQVGLWALICGLILTDQLVKQIMLDWVFTPPKQIIVTSFFNLVPVWNKGISFGLLADYPNLVRYGTIILGILVIIWLARQFTHNPLILRIAGGAIIAGAAGNVIDRIIYGQVIDFLDFHLGEMHWPAFNVADIAISIGVFLWICAILTGRDRLKRQNYRY